MTEKQQTSIASTAAGERVPAQRHAQDLAHMLWGRWPFGDVGWPFGDTATGAAPIRVEEVVENDQVVVRAEIPGVDPDKDIEVTVDQGILRIRAERRESAEDRTGQGWRSEFRYGSFLREVALPPGTSTEVVSASYRDGILEVRLPAPVKGSAARRIAVERG